MAQPVLTKTLLDGKTTLTIDIVPEDGTRLGFWLEVRRDADLLGRVKGQPRKLAESPMPGITHGLSVGGKTVGLTAAEARHIELTVATYVAVGKGRVERARAETADRLRAVAPDAPTHQISDGYSGFTVGESLRHPVFGVVTVLDTSRRFYAEDGVTMGAAADAGYVYLATVRAATDEEAGPVIEAEEIAMRRRTLTARATSEITRSDELTWPADDEVGDLDSLPGARIEPHNTTTMGFGAVGAYEHLRVDRQGGWLWLLRHNGADGDHWGSSNYAPYVAKRMPLTDELAALTDELVTEFGPIEPRG